MLKFKKGCLIKAAQQGEVNVIAHQCNCFVNMGKGIAPLIKRAFPEAWEADKKTVKGDKGKLGQFSLGDSDGVVVYNLYGQYEYGRGKRQTSYKYLRMSLESMRDNLHSEDKIGLPKIGAGLGGGDWNTIQGIIEEVFSDYDVTIYLV